MYDTEKIVNIVIGVLITVTLIGALLPLAVAEIEGMTGTDVGTTIIKAVGGVLVGVTMLLLFLKQLKLKKKN